MFVMEKDHVFVIVMVICEMAVENINGNSEGLMQSWQIA